MSSDDYSRETRDIYHQQHMRIVDDERTMKRHLAMFQEDYFGLEEGWFKGKSVFDAGCGDTAKALIRFYQFGARDLHGIDLGDEFIPVAQKSLANQGIAPEAVVFKNSSVTEIPYENDRFDFVCCHGVLLHLNNMDEVSQAFSELARITKPEGYLYTVFGLVGGLFEEAIIPAVREYYRNNKEFKNLIDNLKPDNFHDVIYKIMSDLKFQTGSSEDLTSILNLFDVDLCVFIQNFIQAPVRLKIDEEFIVKQYKENSFKDIRRLRRFIKRENLRKYFAPLHYDRDFSVSRILYGSGNLEFIAQKTL